MLGPAERGAAASIRALCMLINIVSRNVNTDCAAAHQVAPPPRRLSGANGFSRAASRLENDTYFGSVRLWFGAPPQHHEMSRISMIISLPIVVIAHVRTVWGHNG